MIVAGLYMAGRPRDEHWAYDIAKHTNISDRALTPALDRMRSLGWLTARREKKRRPGCAGNPRVLYRVTADGVIALRRIYHFADGKTFYRQWMPDSAPDVPEGALPRQDRMLHDDPFWRAEKPPNEANKPPRPPRERGVCRHCETEHALRADETVIGHGAAGHGAKPGDRCPGSWMYPLAEKPAANLRR